MKYKYPHIFPLYTDEQYFIDLLIQLPIAIFLGIIALKIFSDTYRKEREITKV
jgi:hypothetical protein